MKDDYISRQAAIDVASGYCHPANIADEFIGGEDVEYQSLPVQEDWFKGMEDYKNYAPEELGL